MIENTIPIIGNIFNIIILSIILCVIAFFLKGLFLIRDDEVGILTKKMLGKLMPQGQIIAREKNEIGIQADTLMPGLYWRFPFIWKIHKADVVEITQKQIGVIESIDGEPLSPGLLLGNRIDCNSYQDARAFLKNKGQKGPQRDILKPGTYRINTELFKITKHPVTHIDEKNVGIIVAQDGVPLPPGYIIAPKPTSEHHFFQDGQAFIDGSGYRGPQLDTIQPGDYYINPFQFVIYTTEIAEVPPGYVAVLRSNVGHELANDKTLAPKIDPKKDLTQQPIHDAGEVVLSTDQNQRGIWIKPVAPGKFNLNPLAFTVYLVPTSAVTIDWASGTELRSEHGIMSSDGQKKVVSKEDTDTEKAKEFFKFSQLRVTSKDGFQLEVDVRMIIRVSPEHASFVIARFGSVSNLIEQIVHPLIDSSFRNKAGEKKAIDFIMSRTTLQEEALEKAKGEFSKYHVDAQNLLIAYIKVDETLLKTQTEKEIALQQQEQYKEQARAQEQRKVVKEKEAIAEKQKDVIDAQLSKQIKKDYAEARKNEAQGDRDYLIETAKGEASKIQATGEAHARIIKLTGESESQVIELKGNATAQAYTAQEKAIGRDILGVIQALDKIKDIDQAIVPQTLITGGDNNQNANSLLTLVLANLAKKGDTTSPSPPIKTPKPKKEPDKDVA